MSAPTGEQYVIVRPTGAGESRAVITELAASLREFSIGGVDIAEPYADDVIPPYGSGIVLVPWPNRIEDGVWYLDGERQQLDITEQSKNNASHGLLRNTGYRFVSRTDDSVTLGATVFPQHGYPFHLDTTVRYELVDDGLAVTHTVTNLSEANAPVAIGTHPYFRIGNVPTADLILTVHAATRFELDERKNVRAEVPVAGTDFDLRNGRRVGDVSLDVAFGSVTTVDGASAVLRAPDGREVSLLQDENHPYVQVFTNPIHPLPDGPGLALAMEPMTAAPNALNNGLGLHWVEPADTWTVRWGVRYSG